ncbi:MAG: hypothetical protein V2J12_12620 [Gammaproteobacteria bacterium]|nr:hypothetical protein [Gammaproteobacteria bacterium]
MKGQIRAMIPAFIGIAPLLLAGTMGYLQNPGAEQTTTIAETRAVLPAEAQSVVLQTAMQADAAAAADEVRAAVAADLAIELQRKPLARLALAPAGRKERG